MPKVNVSGVDLNLLPLLDALLTERHVTRAARRVGLSQPAASRGLARLRELLGDPLLLRAGAATTLTARAESLRAPVRQALALVEEAVAAPAPFHPARVRRTVRLASDDYCEMVLLPPLLGRLAKAAPGLDLWVSAATSAGALAALASGDVDFTFGPIVEDARLPPGVAADRLFDERFVCLTRKGHPLSRRPTLDGFVAARHAFIAPRGLRGGVVDDALANLGKERHVALAVPHFLVMPFLVAASDLVVTLAERVARTYARSLPLTRFAPPLALPGFTVGLFMHERHRHDPALVWFRQEALATATTLSSRRR